MPSSSPNFLILSSSISELPSDLLLRRLLITRDAEETAGVEQSTLDSLDFFDIGVQMTFTCGNVAKIRHFWIRTNGHCVQASMIPRVCVI